MDFGTICAKKWIINASRRPFGCSTFNVHVSWKKQMAFRNGILVSITNAILGVAYLQWLRRTTSTWKCKMWAPTSKCWISIRAGRWRWCHVSHHKRKTEWKHVPRRRCRLSPPHPHSHTRALTQCSLKHLFKGFSVFRSTRIQFSNNIYCKHGRAELDSMCWYVLLLRQRPKIRNKLNFKQHFLNNFLCLKAYRQPNIHTTAKWARYLLVLRVRLNGAFHQLVETLSLLLRSIFFCRMNATCLFRYVNEMCESIYWARCDVGFVGWSKTPPKTQRNYKQTRIKLKTDKSFRDENVLVQSFLARVRLCGCMFADFIWAWRELRRRNCPR